MSDFLFQWRLCRRPLFQPVQTANETWRERLSLIVRLEDADGRSGYGEVAPIEAFGSESLDYAAQCLRSLGSRLDLASILRIVPNFRATRFGLTCALADLQAEAAKSILLPRAALLKLDASLELACRRLADEGFRVAKVKVGVGDGPSERQQLREVLATLPDGFQLRLDANGSMDLKTLETWVACFSGEAKIECLEQALLPSLALKQVSALKTLNQRLPLALDESVSSAESWKQWTQELQWPGILVLKPSVFGSLDECRQAIADRPEQVILSSSFESLVGLRALLRLAAEFELKRPLGLGTVDYFVEQRERFSAADLAANALSKELMNDLWESLEVVI
ncbi:MAG: o-succinylbenzoate synthase [Opitutales bacterium]|nr:o-succinylbenzoate synthase [Opitutales bacterium]